MSEKIYAQQMNRATLRDVIPIIGYDSEESIFFHGRWLDRVWF